MSAGDWMLTASGREFYLGGPRAILGNAPDLKDIAHHLAQINRFTGACSRPYSVAEHSLLVERIGRERDASPGLRLALLMHDAHEAYTSDMSSPAKQALGIPWVGFEAMHANNVRRHFNLRTAFAAWRAEVTACDLIALATERRDLTAWQPGVHEPWPVLDTPGKEVWPAPGIQLDPEDAPIGWRLMRDMFLDTYLQLRNQVQAAPTSTEAAAS
jgi:hypothetical protein